MFILGCVVFICDFHHEQAWDRCLITKSNGLVEDRLKILCLFRMIARADTLEVCEAAIQNLKNSSYWKNQETLRRLYIKILVTNKISKFHLLGV